MEQPELTHTRSISKLYLIGGYLAIWPTAYALGVFVLSGWTVGHAFPNWESIVYILLCAHSCYLLDRVKIADHRQDPADAIALPERAMLYSRFATPIRVLLILELLAGTAVGWLIFPILMLIPVVALCVVHLYAGRGATPSSPRLKDLPAVKAFFIASGHLALSIAVLWANQHDLLTDLHLMSALAIIGTWMIVAGDAILCDIDDHDADMMYSTKSLAVMLGSRSAWISALGFITLGSLLISLHQSTMIGVGATLIAATLITRKNTNHRDFVDARLLPIVLIWMFVL